MVRRANRRPPRSCSKAKTGRRQIGIRARRLPAATGANASLRLQCYEGIDVAQAVYDWNYAKQRWRYGGGADRANAPDLFSEAFLLRRPCCRRDASAATGGVLLIR